MEHPHTHQAYLELIRALLHCPKGEEMRVLHTYGDLITPELLQVMQEVATALATEGHESSARFLRHWEAQLAHSLSHQTHLEHQNDRAEVYLQLIRALMDCPQGSEQQLLAAHPDLVDQGLVQALQQVATQAALQGDQKTARDLHHWAEEVSRSLTRTPEAVPSHPPDRSDHSIPNPAPTSAQDQRWFQDLEALLSQLQAAGHPSQNDHVTPSSPPQDTGSESEISKALFRLGSILKGRLHPYNPLWYMEVLERAAAQGWVLSTDEVEHLIGVKPRFPVGKHTFEWRCWIFEKTGRIGSQLAWRVRKAQVESIQRKIEATNAKLSAKPN